MRFRLAVKGDLVRAMTAEKGRIARAVTKALDDVGGDAQEEYRRQVEAAFGPRGGRKLARTIRIKRFPRSDSVNAAVFIFSRAPEIIAGSDSGAVILPKQGRFLAIPTNFNRAHGRRGTRAERGAGGFPGVRVTPEEMVKSGLAFTRPRKDGPGFIWFLKVTRAQKRVGKRGKLRDLAFAGGLFLVGSGRVGRTRDILEAGAVPMFVLVPQVRIPKKLSIARIRSKAERRLPREIRHNLETLPPEI